MPELFGSSAMPLHILGLEQNWKETMAIETITREGDFVLKNNAHGDLLRVHMTEDAMIIWVRGVTVNCAVSEAEELRDWITRRLEEPI